MKKNLALILALVMLLSTVFAVVPMAAEAEATPPAAASKYEPKISYANINYSDKMYMMFAVPAPATLDEGNTVNLLVWNGIASEAYSIKDQNAELLSAEADKVTIGEAQYLVFKYGGLTAADMTKIISARPVVANTWEETVKVEISPEEKNDAGEVIKEAVYEDQIVVHKDAVEYGDIVEYSVLEYVATAKGEFGGAALADDVIAMLDSMLMFGSLAQKYSSSEHEFLADDELSKIWYVPVIKGVVGEKVFGGFFKKGAELVTVSAPYVEGYAFTSFIDAEGNALYDIDGLVDNGEQMLVAGEGALPLGENGDLVIKANYDILYMAKADANLATITSIDHWIDKSGNKYSSAQGGLGCNLSNPPAASPTPYASIDVVDDPYVAGNKVYRVTGNHPHSMGLGNSTTEWKASFKVNGVPGFGDTIAPLATVEFTVARDANGDILRTGNLRLRNSASGNMFNIGYFEKGGTFMLYTDGTTKNPTPLPTTVAENGWTRYVFTLDLANEVIYVYASNANGDLMYQGQTSNPNLTGTFTGKSWMEILGGTDVRVEWTGGGGYNSFSVDELAGGVLADLDGDGIGETSMYVLGEDGTPKLDGDGKNVINESAVKWCYKQYRSMYLKDFCTYVGTPVDQLLPESFEMYNVDANSAVNATTKNALDYVNNFGDEELVSKLGLPAGSTFGGLGTNFQSVVVTNYVNYAGLDIIDDPYQAGNKVYSFNGTDAGIIWQAENIKIAGSKPAYTSSLKISTRAPGFFTGSVYPVITYDMTVGGNGTDRMLETDTIRLRGASNTYVHLFKIAADGSILICKPNADYTDAEFVDTGADVQLNGYTRIVAEVDCLREQFKLYAANEGEALVCVATIDALWITAKNLSRNYHGSVVTPKTFATWMDMAKALDRTEIMIDDFGANALTEAELANLADAAAVQAYCRQNRVLLIKDWDTYLGYAK